MSDASLLELSGVIYFRGPARDGRQERAIHLDIPATSKAHWDLAAKARDQGDPHGSGIAATFATLAREASDRGGYSYLSGRAKYDYRLDLRDDGGLSCVAKRLGAGDRAASVAERLRATLGAALRACRTLELEESFAGAMRFRGGDVSFTLLDRLHARDDEASRAALAAPFEDLLDRLYGSAPIDLGWDDEDPRRPLSMRVRVREARDLETLLRRVA